MYQIKVKDSAINNLLGQCCESAQTGNSKFPGMSYEQGIDAAIRWIIGDEKMNPFED